MLEMVGCRLLVVVANEEPWVSPFVDNWVLLPVSVNKQVVDVVEVEAMTIHVCQAYQKRCVCRHNGKADQTKWCINLYVSKRHTLGVVTKSDAVASCR